MVGLTVHIMEDKKEISYYIDKFEDGSIEMHRYDRTYANKVGDNKGEALGHIMTILSNHLDHMPNGETLEIVFKKIK